MRPPRRLRLPRPDERYTLGAGLAVSPICLTPRDGALLAPAFTRGVNFLLLEADPGSADDVHRDLAESLGTGAIARDELVVGGLVRGSDPQHFRAALGGLVDVVEGLDRLELVVIADAIADGLEPRLDAIRALRADGAFGISAIGAQFCDSGTTLRAINCGAVDIAFLHYSPAQYKVRLYVLPHLLADRRTLIYNYGSAAHVLDGDRWSELGLTEDTWQPTRADHLRFALTRAEIDGLWEVPAHLEDLSALLAAVEAAPLDRDEEDHLVALAERDKTLRGESPQVVAREDLRKLDAWHSKQR